MKTQLKLLTFASIVMVMLLIAACTTNPVTGRRQAIIMSEEHAHSMGHQAFQELLATSKAVENPAQQAMVKQVFERITLATEKLYFARTQSNLNFEWKIILIDKPNEINAFALPGGKFGIYSGILPIAQTNAGLAVIIGHEASHALLRHAAERYSNMQIVGLGGVAAGAIGGSETSQAYQTIAQYGYALPFSRSQETEADVVGLELTAMAGYDPRAAIGVWQRMDAQDRQRVFEFASTHPNPGSRIAVFQDIMPRMMEIYHHSVTQQTMMIPGIAIT